MVMLLVAGLTLASDSVFQQKANAASDGIDLYEQCANDDGDGYSTGDTGCRWTGGALNASNSTLHEDDATVQRLAIDNLTTGDHTVTIKYGTTKGGKNAYDFLTDDTFSEDWVTAADLCDPAITNLDDCATLPAIQSGLIPSDPNALGHDTARADRHFTIRNGTWVSIGTPTLVSGTYAGDSDTAITITFNVNSATCENVHANKCEVLITWGAHISTQADWGAGNSAVNIAGSPYHVQIAAVDSTSLTGGGRDNQMQASAIIVPSTITIHKVTSPVGGTGFAFTTTGTGYNGFSLDHGQQNQQSVDPGSYSVTETNPSPAYALTGLSCTASGTGTSANTSLVNRSVSITIGSGGGGVVDCTYTNTLQQAHLTLLKTVINNDGGTALDTAWTLAAVGPTNISGAEGSGAVTNAAINAGAYTLSESGGPTGYTASTYSCVNNGGAPVISNNITLAPGDNATCTITNDDQAAHLVVIKHVINDNGGSAIASNFTTTISGVSTATPSAAGVESPGVDNVLTSVGSYSVDEGAHVGYTKTLSADCSGAIALGQTKTCTITNDDIAPSLTLVKQVINDNGGTAVAGDWTLTASGYDSASPDAGTYNLSESAGPTGYSMTSLTCSDSGAAQVTSVTLSLDEDVTCTFVNNDVSPRLIVIKHVINDNGGTSVAGDFTMNVSGTNVSNPSFPGVESPGTGLALNVGAYNVTESGPSGYSASFSTDCTGTAQLGVTKTCTITNDDISPRLIIIKHVINDNGGTAVAADFALDSGGDNDSPDNFSGAEAPGIVVTLNAGAYNVTESGPSGYAASFSADCSGSIAVGVTKTCTVTNDDIQPRLIVIKHVINDNGGTALASAFTMNVTANTPSDDSFPGVEAPGTGITLNAGAYTVSESGPSGYAASFSADCTGTAVIGVTKTCTVTNNDISPILTIVKNAEPNDCQDFTFSMTGQSNFLLDDSSGVQACLDTDRPQSQTFNNLIAGDPLTVTEALPNSFWTFDSASCVVTVGTTPFASTPATNGLTITLGLADNVTCTFINNKISPTRTQGFWQTHTAYTSSIFASNFSGGMQIGTAPHKGLITNTQSTGLSELFGAYFSNIAQKSTGKGKTAQRTEIEKARMQLLQQLVTAKLNCAAFGCTTSIQAMITTADSNYASGTIAQILASAAALDAYNNSGDTIIISGTPGSATPQLSKSWANLGFWDTP
jgi:hypothetical protein